MFEQKITKLRDPDKNNNARAAKGFYRQQLSDLRGENFLNVNLK